MIHASHVTRFSDSSVFDEICVRCGATDTPNTGTLHELCPNPPKEGEDPEAGRWAVGEKRQRD